MSRLRNWARRIKRDVVALSLAVRDPRVPWPVKLLAALVIAYALSPIDLIPDFVPVLGLLDDLILVPLGLLLVIRLLPPGLLDEHRDAAEHMGRAPASRAAAVAIVAIWLVAGVALTLWLLEGV